MLKIIKYICGLLLILLIINTLFFLYRYGIFYSFFSFIIPIFGISWTLSSILFYLMMTVKNINDEMSIVKTNDSVIFLVMYFVLPAVLLLLFPYHWVFIGSFIIIIILIINFFKFILKRKLKTTAN